MDDNTADTNRQMQNKRLNELKQSLDEIVLANGKAIELLIQIISTNPKRMLMGKENIVIRGDLATYCVPIEPILNRMKSPFSNGDTGFAQVEVHPKDHFVSNESRACIQVEASEEIPAGDIIASYLLGLSNDLATWTKPNMSPLRDALLQTYGLTLSPLTEPLVKYLQETHSATMDIKRGYLTLAGTNGFIWRIGFGNPLVYGFSLEMKKPRQKNWQLISEDTRHLPSSYRFGNFIDAAALISEFPKSLIEDEWSSFSLVRRIVGQYYKPLAAKIHKENTDGDIYHLDHPDSLNQILSQLDKKIAKLASA
jgi:hypothetical protein|tara:strand:- start:889 stop:1818 length:930 start_codon:yes stop_codon:yes gene_type:complete